MVHFCEWFTLSQVSSGGIKQENKEKKKKLRKVKKGKRVIFGTKRGKCEHEGGEERERERGRGFFRFFLRSIEIEQLVFIRERRKVYPRIASYES